MAESPFKIGSPRDFQRKKAPDLSLAQGRVQPQANDVEEVVLGALMLDKDAISVVLDILQPESFYTEGHQAIYKAMLTLFDKNSAIDLLTVKDQLQKTGELDKAGGPYALVKLSNRVGSAANVEYHARIIAQKSIARDLIKASSEVLQDAYDDTVDVFDLLDEAEKKIFKITEDKLSRGVESIAELGPKALKLLEEIKAKSNEAGGLTGVPTGFADLDKVTNGWQPSDMIVLAARPGMGKCLGKGTPVIMYDGTRKAVEEVRVGDLLMGDDSTPRRVLSLARGRERMYWVRQTFGEDYRVNESHILTIKRDGLTEDIELRDLLAEGEAGLDRVRGFRVSVNYGAAVGEEDYYITGRQFADALVDDCARGACARVAVGALPQNTLRVARTARMELLAGVLDGVAANGTTVWREAGAYRFETEDAAALDQLGELVSDLGLRFERCARSGFTEVYIAGRADAIPVREVVPCRPAATEDERLAQSRLTIEPDGVGDYYGFTIDGNRRFLLGDGTVTHNTAFVLSIARNAAMDFGRGVAIFSLEMANVQLVQRLLSMEAQVDSKKMRSGQMSDEEWDKLQQGIERLSAAPIYIDDTPAINIFELRAKCRRLKMQHDIQLVVIDYLQLMSGNSSGKNTNREQEISAISRNLKQLAKEINVPVIALSQLSRAVEQRGGDKRPMLSDLRECVPGHTLVCLADGRRVPIRELVGTTPKVLAVDEDGKLLEGESDMVWSVGEKKTYRVRLRSGRSIEATAEHRLWRFGGWATVAELSVGDRLASARQLPEPGEVETWPDYAVALLGQLIGDGSYLSGQPLRFTSNHEDNLVTVRKAAEALGCTVKRYDHPRGWTQLLLSGNGNRWHPAGVNAWLRDLGIFDQRSHEKRVPRRAFRLSNVQIALLLRHLWATDGTIYTRPVGRKGSNVIQYATNSPGLAADVAALLLRLGITARKRMVQKGDHRPGYHVIVSGSADQRVFLKLVGGFGPRAEQASELMNALEGVVGNTNTDTVPAEIFDHVKQRMRERGISHRSMADLRGTSYGGNAHFAFAPSRETVGEYAQLLRSPRLSALATNDLYWDEIVGIEAIGMQEVFDLTVPGPSCWIADGIVSHNSGAIEQDADMVNFIYRPEYYDIDQDQDGNSLKGVAKIIIAKNRHGELKDVQLRWVAEQARFDNWEDVDFNSFTNLSPFQPDGGGDGSVTLQSRVNTDDEEIAF